jgi:hypothetical protein
MKPLSISIASAAILAAASFGVQAQQQPLPQDNAPAAKSAPSGGAASDRPAAAGGNSTSDRPNRAESSDKPDQKNATEKSGDGMNKDGKSAEKSGDGMNKDGKSAEKSRDSMNKDGKSAEKSGDGMNKDGKSAEKSGDGTSKDGKSAEKPGDSMNKDGKSAEKPGDSMNKDGKSAEKSADNMNKDSKSGDKPKQVHVDIKPEQKTVIKQTFVKENIRPQKIDVQVRVGVRIPRTVVLHALPPTIIEIYPAYRPYKFVMVDDDTILVIDPSDGEIVDVITV